MRILLVSATLLELRPLLPRLGLPAPAERTMGRAGTLLRADPCDILITGVGQLQCAVHVTNVLAAEPYDVVVQAGIAGSFDPALGPRAVVWVEEDRPADLGAETVDGFVDITDMGLLDPDQPPFTDGWLRGPRAWVPAAVPLPFARAVTVNRVLADPRSIAWVRERYRPHIVQMEGAALFHACLVRKIPFVALRAISDMVGTNDRAAWDMAGAIDALSNALWPCLEALAGRPPA